MSYIGAIRLEFDTWFDQQDLPEDSREQVAVGYVAGYVQASKELNMTDEEIENYLIQYRCPICGHAWEEVYDCACDSDCDECGCRDITALSYQAL